MIRSLAAVCGLAAGLLVVCAPAVSAAEPKPGVQVPQSVKLGDAEVRYWLFLPKQLAEDPAPRPLMLFLHGAGERGDHLELVKKHGPPKLVDSQPEFPFILVSPQCPTGQRWDAEVLLALLDHVQKTQPVDPRRVVVTGLSMGGYGTWALLAAAPQRFAAAVPICGGGDPATAEKFKNVPIWVFHGEKDQAVPIERSEAMVKALEAIGGNVKFTRYPEAGHDSWTETYANPKLYQWLLSQVRPAES